MINLLIIEKANIFNIKIENFLIKNIEEKFDIFFLDPPFKDESFLENLNIIKKKKIFNKSHIVVIHREKSSKDKFNKFLKLIETKIYGRSKIIFGRFI